MILLSLCNFRLQSGWESHSPITSNFLFKVFSILIPGMASLPTFASNQNHIIVEADSFTFTEPAPIQLFLDELKGDATLALGKHAATFNEIRLGIGIGDYRVSVFTREDYALYFSPDTFTLVYNDKNDLSFQNNKTYQVSLSASHIRAKGMSFGYRFTPSWAQAIELSFNWFLASDLLDGSINGSLSQSNDGDISGDLSVDYHYSEDYLFKRDVSAWQTKSAYGFSMDLSGVHQLPMNSSISWSLRDIGGTLYWKDAPYSDLDMSSTTIEYDENNTAHRRPVMQGREGFQSHRQKMPLRIKLDYSWTAKSLPIGSRVQWEKWDKIQLVNTDLIWTLGDKNALFAGYEHTTEATRIGIDSTYVQCLISLDETSFDTAHSARIQFNLRATW